MLGAIYIDNKCMSALVDKFLFSMKNLVVNEKKVKLRDSKKSFRIP